MKPRTIRVDTLARVEGEGGLTIRMNGREVEDVELRIFEPPRLFEGLLRGRDRMEAPDITARICGICPVAYLMSACQAVEDAAGVSVSAPIRALRRLLYCGEWIESHALHIYLLQAPDFLGEPDAVAVAKTHPEIVQRGLRLKKTGNDLMRAIGGREVHPVNVRVGGFYRAPSRAELASHLNALRRAREDARETLAWVSNFSFPTFDRDYQFVALRHPSEYPITEGRITSNRGRDIAAREFESHLVEEHVARSNALHAELLGRGPYVVGPLARITLNFDRPPPVLQAAARASGLEPPCRNPFKGILARAVELIYAVEEAIRIIEAYVPPDPPAVDVPARAGTGCGVTEAPRGILYHRYRLDPAGMILEARIVPPTSQNQRSMEEDLRDLGPDLADLPLATATALAEQAVRNYDPCISCATHFLRLTIDRGGGS